MKFTIEDVVKGIDFPVDFFGLYVLENIYCHPVFMHYFVVFRIIGQFPDNGFHVLIR